MDYLRSLFDSPLGGIFSIISLYYAYRGARLVWVAWQRRESFNREPLTRAKKAWAEQAAFLVAVPPGVFIHELGHALAVWQFGGEVVRFVPFFYWGYVQSTGSFTATQDWFISLAGTIGTLLYALVVWLWLRHRETSLWRYFGLRILRFHIIYALIYYPLFTLFTFVGDWRTIYDFGQTPLLSASTLLVHVSALALFWWTDRQGWFERPAFQSTKEQEALASLRAQADLNPADEQLQLQTINTLLRNGLSRQGRERLEQFLARHPHSAEGHLLRAFVTADNRQHLPAAALRDVREALQLGLTDPLHVAQAHVMLARYELGVEKLDEALRHLDQALGEARRGSGAEADAQRQRLLAQIHYLRATTYRRRRQYQLADHEIEQAIQQVRESGTGQIPPQYQNERENIRRQAGYTG